MMMGTERVMRRRRMKPATIIKWSASRLGSTKEDLGTNGKKDVVMGGRSG